MTRRSMATRSTSSHRIELTYPNETAFWKFLSKLVRDGKRAPQPSLRNVSSKRKQWMAPTSKGSSFFRAVACDKDVRSFLLRLLLLRLSSPSARRNYSPATQLFPMSAPPCPTNARVECVLASNSINCQTSIHVSPIQTLLSFRAQSRTRQN